MMTVHIPFLHLKMGFDILNFMRSHRLLLLAAMFLLIPSTGFPAEFRVTPIKLIFDQQFKNGLITVINEGDDLIQMEIKASEWTQDSKGKDLYKDTSDLIFFPKILKIAKGKQRVVRAGVKTPAISSEKTYRLFIRELPQAVKESQGAQVRFSVQFALPIFSKPIKEEIKGEITNLSFGNGRLAFNVHNPGNTHFRINSIIIRGFDSNGVKNFSKLIDGWYLLAEATRPYNTSISQEICEDVSKFSVEVKSDQLTLRDELDVIKTLCLP